MEKKRLNEVAYGLLLRLLSRHRWKPDTSKIKREAGSLVPYLEKAGIKASKEEVQEVLKQIVQDFERYSKKDKKTK